MISALLLAAGKSSRMGQMKALLPWGQFTLIESQIQQISQSEIDELIIVIGYRNHVLHPRIKKAKRLFSNHLKIRTVVNHQYENGKISSILKGIEIIDQTAKGLAIIGVDQPVRSQTINMLVKDLNQNEIRIPIYGGKKGHPPVFSSTFFTEIKKIREEDEGLRSIVQRFKQHVRSIHVPHPQVLLNLNRKEDYDDAVQNQLDLY